MSVTVIRPTRSTGRTSTSTVSGAVRDEDSVSDEDFWAKRAKAMTVQQLIDLLATVDDKTLPVLSATAATAGAKLTASDWSMPVSAGGCLTPAH